MANLTPQDYFDLYGSKRPNSNIVQTYRIRKKTNNHPNYPGSLDHIVYLVLFEGKFLKKSELYAYTYLPEYFDLPEQYNNKPGKLEISGVYKGVNLFIENPEVANSLGNCITGITVNGTQKPGGTGTTRVEIDFSYFDVKVGDDITIVINYDTSCKIDVINPEAVLGTDDNVQTNNIGEINERYKKIKEATEKKLSDEESKVRDEKQEIDLAIYKIQKKPNDQITDEEKIELQNLKEKGIKMGPEWTKRIADIKVELSNIEKNKIQEINSNKSTIREIERLVVAENLPINLTELAIDKMGRNFDNLLLKALKIKDLEVIEGDFYTVEDLTPVPNESVIERDKLFGTADEIVEAVIKNFKYMDSPADYEIIQYPWDPNDVPPEETSEQTIQTKKEDPAIREPLAKNEVRARGEYSVKVGQNSDTIKLIGLDGKFFLFPDGTRRELGELTLVKKEDPNDPNIIKILEEEYERQDELSDEYLEDEYVGEGLGTTFGGTLGDQIKPEQTPDYVSSPSSNSSSSNYSTPSGQGEQAVFGDDADYWAFIAVCYLEDPTYPEEPAQIIYNRYGVKKRKSSANGQGYGLTIKEIVIAKWQFQPAFQKSPNNGMPSQYWKDINSMETAITAVLYSRGGDSRVSNPKTPFLGYADERKEIKARLEETEKRVKDSNRQSRAREFVGGRTGFRSSNSPVSSSWVGTIQYKPTSNKLFWESGTVGHREYYREGRPPGSPPSNLIS